MRRSFIQPLTLACCLLVTLPPNWCCALGRGTCCGRTRQAVVGNEIISAMARGLLIADEVVDIFLPVRFSWVRRTRWMSIQAERVPAAAKRLAQVDGPALKSALAATCS